MLTNQMKYISDHNKIPSCSATHISINIQTISFIYTSVILSSLSNKRASYLLKCIPFIVIYIEKSVTLLKNHLYFNNLVSGFRTY